MASKLVIEQARPIIVKYLKEHHFGRDHSFETKNEVEPLQKYLAQEGVKDTLFTNEVELCQFLYSHVLYQIPDYGLFLLWERDGKKHIRFVSNEPSDTKRYLDGRSRRTISSSEKGASQSEKATELKILEPDAPVVRVNLSIFRVSEVSQIAYKRKEGIPLTEGEIRIEQEEKENERRFAQQIAQEVVQIQQKVLEAPKEPEEEK